MAISDRVGIDTAGYSPVQAAPPPSTQQLEQPLMPTRNPFLRFSAPNIPGSFPSSDTLRGFHLGGQIPQYRIPVSPAASASGTGSTTSNVAVINNNQNVTVSQLGIIQNATFNIPPISPGGLYTGSLTLNGEGWLLYTISCSYLMRVRGYSTANAQITDQTRPITQGPGFGTEQDVVFDVNLDTLPAQWDFTAPVIAVNQNPGVSQLLYITVTNNSASISAGSFTLEYAPIAGFAGQL